MNRQQRDENIAVLTRAGHSTGQIAKFYGVTDRTIQRARRRMGVTAPGCSNMLTDDEKRRAAELLDDGASYREVARTLGRSDVCIAQNFPGRSQWKPGSGSEYRKLLATLDAIAARILVIA